jgi:hypothetical protein
MEDTVYHFQEFAFLDHLMCHPCTYVPCIMLGEGEWESDVKEGCVEAYKYAAVVVVGLYWDLRAGWRSRMKGPFVPVEAGGPVEGVFSCEPGK